MIIDTFINDHQGKTLRSVTIPFLKMSPTMEGTVADVMLKLRTETGHSHWSLYSLVADWDDMVLHMEFEKLTEEELNNRLRAIGAI